MTLDAYRLDPESLLPRYHQIRENILGLIQSGHLREGDALPPERDLGEAYGVNRLTVRQAISELVEMGVIRRVHGVGTFVNERQPITPLVPTIAGFTERMRRAGMRPTSRVLSLERVRGVRLPSGLFSDKGVFSSDDELVCLKRLRAVNDEPLMLETAYLPAHRFSDLLQEDFSRRSLYQTLQDHYGTTVYDAEQTMEPVLLQPDEAAHFGLATGQAAMLVHILAFDHTQQWVEYSKSIIRGDRCRYYLKVSSRTA
jgi:GntR family transcriptional regulator